MGQTSALSGSHQIKHSTSSRSSWAEYSSAGNVLFHVGGMFSVFVSFRPLTSRFQGFDYIIKGYCKDRYGDCRVRWGDYEVIRPDDGHIIDASEFASTVQPGMVLEISITLWQGEAICNHKKKCPRCYHINQHTAIARGWIEWKVFLSTSTSS